MAADGPREREQQQQQQQRFAQSAEKLYKWKSLFPSILIEFTTRLLEMR